MTVGGKAVAASKSCTVETNCETKEAGMSGTGSWKRYITGRKSWQVSVSYDKEPFGKGRDNGEPELEDERRRGGHDERGRHPDLVQDKRDEGEPRARELLVQGDGRAEMREWRRDGAENDRRHDGKAGQGAAVLQPLTGRRQGSRQGGAVGAAVIQPLTGRRQGARQGGAVGAAVIQPLTGRRQKDG